jgi:hypothetical protein
VSLPLFTTSKAFFYSNLNRLQVCHNWSSYNIDERKGVAVERPVGDFPAIDVQN